jgi:hypothetical protein
MEAALVKPEISRPISACAQHARKCVCDYLIFGVIGLAAMLALTSAQSAIYAADFIGDPESPIVPASLFGVVFFDPNHNGQLDNLEWAISGVTIELWKNGQAAPVATTTVSSTGQYSFLDILPGTYTLKNTTSGNWLPVPGTIYPTSGSVKTTGLGTGDTDQSDITDIVLAAGDKGINYFFAAQDYPIQLLSKRMLLASSLNEQTHAVPEPSSAIMLIVAAIAVGLGTIGRRYFN